MKKLLILALFAGSCVMASAEYNLEVTHSSEFNPDKLVNAYTNVVKVTKSGGSFAPGEEFTIVRRSSDRSQNIAVTILPSSKCEINGETFTRTSNKITFEDKFTSNTDDLYGIKTNSYVYSLDGNSVEIPVYSATLSAKLVNDYSVDQILTDIQGTLAVQECEISRSSGEGWMMYKKNKQSFVALEGLSDRDEVSETEQTYVGSIVNGENSYGSNSSTIYPGIASSDIVYTDDFPMRSIYKYFSGGKKYRYYKVPLDLYFEYKPLAGNTGDGGWTFATHGIPTIQSDEATGGFRVWRKLEDGAETLVFDNVGDELVAEKSGSRFYIKGCVADDEFSAEVNTTLQYRVRAYYYMDKKENNPYGAPALHAPAVKAQEKRFYISEYVCTFVLDDEDDAIVTNVQDMGAKQVSSVKYYNLAGIESGEAFDGVNIVVTHYNDGTKSVSKVIR